jgi:hypothetical protein
MFSGLGDENSVFQSFVFNNFSGLGGYACGGQYVCVHIAPGWPFD